MNKPPVKQFCQSDLNPDQVHFVVRQSRYGTRLILSDFLALFEEAQKDFPDLTAEDVRLIHCGAPRRTGYIALEFTLKGKPPEGYREISMLEFARR